MGYMNGAMGSVLLRKVKSCIWKVLRHWREGELFLMRVSRLRASLTCTFLVSVVTLDKCVRNFSRFTGCSLGEAIKCATYNPAKFVLDDYLLNMYANLRFFRCLGIEDKKGTLRPGAHADFVVLDRQGIVLSTWVRGKEAWAKKV